MRKKIDSTFQKIIANDTNRAFILASKQTKFSHFPTNSERFKSIDSLISKIYISISRDQIDLEALNGYLKGHIERKGLPSNYGLLYNNTNPYSQEQMSNAINAALIKDTLYGPRSVIKIKAKSNFIPRDASLTLYFKDITFYALKKTTFGIIVSIVLIVAVFCSLFYLLKIIRKQKELAEIKDDLISNITHELKTPITTISAALQALQSFHALEDKVKTQKYLEVSQDQVEKLQLMAEKILETATLDQNNLDIHPSEVNLNNMIVTLVKKFKITEQHKSFEYHTNADSIKVFADSFHLENALNNILDNAIKYGGNTISITLTLKGNCAEIQISDNGVGIDKKEQQYIFDKFYRIPTGNIHNVKGFGIGLYYAKHIIEKHGGNLTLFSEKNSHTTFTITLPLA